MDFRDTPDEAAFRDEVRTWLAENMTSEFAPLTHGRGVDRDEHWDLAVAWERKLGAAGWIGLSWPPEYGGRGASFAEQVIFSTEYARADAPIRIGFFGEGLLGPTLVAYGTEEQKRRWLPKLASGEHVGSIAMTEPGTGSDLQNIKTRAIRDGDEYVINGAKTFITNGVRADFLVCAVKTTPDGGHQGISFLILEREMPGYEVSRKLEKMGWHSSDTGELSFTDVEVPDENLLGSENRGFYLIMENFAWERLLMALGAVGGMRRLLAVAISYAGEREAFGRPIGKFQAIRHKIAEIGVKAEVGRALTYHALRRFVAGEETIADVTKAKLYTQPACVEVADEVLQILGGYGYMREYGVERALRDARLGPIGGGTDEVMKEILGRQLGL